MNTYMPRPAVFFWSAIVVALAVLRVTGRHAGLFDGLGAYASPGLAVDDIFKDLALVVTGGLLGAWLYSIGEDPAPSHRAGPNWAWDYFLLGFLLGWGPVVAEVVAFLFGS